MNSGLKILLLLLALGVAAFFVQSALRGPAEAPPTPLAGQPDGDGQPGSEDPAEQRVVEPAERTTPPPAEVQRTALDERSRSAEDAPQGIEGRVVDSFGNPVAEAGIFLFEGHGTNLFEAMMLQSRGVIRPPIATDHSEADGTFRVGVANLPPGKNYELRVTHERHADLVKPNLTLFEGKWFDAGTLQLQAGLVVLGRVVAQGSAAPVADATVLLKPANQTLVMAPTPGREEGIATRTDAYGNFRFENATPGIMTVAAYAPGHARVERVNQNVRTDAENRFDFELPPGKAIAGVVTDGDGRPVHGARVQVLAISSKNPITIDTRSDRDGRFEALGLVDGPYQVLVTALGYVRADEKPVMAGEVDKHVVLETQGKVRVQVSASSGRRLNRYSIWVKSYIAQQDTYGNLMHMPEIRVGARDLDDAGFYEVTGLDPATYALEVHAEGYAKAYSEPFTVTIGGETPELSVRVSEGGAIRGSLIGQDGRPVGGVQVATLPNDYEENALAEMFAPMIPFKISKSFAQSRGDGIFQLDRLIPGTYQLRFVHPEHYTIFEKDIVVEEGRTTEIQPVRLMQGTALSGTVTLDGAPAPQIKVQISAAPDPEAQKPNMFSAVAVSDQEGRWVLPKRLPPGRYTASAGRQDNPFQMVVDYQQTKQEFQVGPGQPQHQIFFRIQSQ
jgi:uncharacterized GH25 family protein